MVPEVARRPASTTEIIGHGTRSKEAIEAVGLVSRLSRLGRQS
jgi:hypothetical protein